MTSVLIVKYVTPSSILVRRVKHTEKLITDIQICFIPDISIAQWTVI